MSVFELRQAVVTDVDTPRNRCNIDMNGRGYFDVDCNPAYQPQPGDRCWVITRGSFGPWVLDKVRSRPPAPGEAGRRDPWQGPVRHIALPDPRETP
jgi:hypothetical protein